MSKIGFELNKLVVFRIRHGNETGTPLNKNFRLPKNPFGKAPLGIKQIGEKSYSYNRTKLS